MMAVSTLCDWCHCPETCIQLPAPVGFSGDEYHAEHWPRSCV